MGYTANDIRNICLLGHGGDGKSALCESMLFTTKAITRLGKRADGTTVSDFDDEEKKRQYSISSSVIPVEYNKCKLNVIDNPGYFDFAGQIVQSLRVVDAGLICLTAKSGIGVGTEKGWKYLAKANLPAMFYVSKLDEEHANFFNVLDSLREMFGASVIPFTFPIMQGETAVGLVDLIEKKAYDANGNAYSNGLNFSLYPVIAKTVYTEYAPNGQYKRLTGTWVVEGDTSDDFIGTVRIYVDDHLQYEVSSLTVNSPASALSLSISGASTVRIEVEGAFASLRAVGYLYLADAKFEN